MSEKIGTGHLMRCLTFANIAQKSYYVFVIRDPDGYVINLLSWWSQIKNT